MQYSKPVVWTVTVILAYCVMLATKKRSKPAMWGAVAIVAYFVLLATDDYSQLAFRSAICGLIYFVLLRISPAAARVLLCAGGALAGALVVGAAAISLIELFQDGWNTFGVVIWVTPVFAAAGLLIGFWVVYQWTEPAQLELRE